MSHEEPMRRVVYLDLATGEYREADEPLPSLARKEAGRSRQRGPRLFDVRALMERPFFALAGKPPPALPPYRSPDGRLTLNVEALDPARGVATIRDADSIIYVVSAMTAARTDAGGGEAELRTLCVQPGELLKAIGRPTGGRQFQLLAQSLERLRGTRIRTNIGPDGCLRDPQDFSLIESWQHGGRGRPWRIVLSAWLADAINQRQVLPISPDYFALSGGHERWLYRVARKHAGHQREGWTATLPMLWRKAGALSPLPRFVFELRRLCEIPDRLPEYGLTWREPDGDRRYPEIHFERRLRDHAWREDGDVSPLGEGQTSLEE
jgi:plasmid replication initiation protein